MINRISNIEDAQMLAQAIVNTIPEPFVVLDEDLRVLAASHSFYTVFRVDTDSTRGAKLYDLGNGQWDIPALRTLLEKVIPERTAMDNFEVEHDFPGVGHRIMLLDARKVIYEDSAHNTILLAFRDITARRIIERERADLLEQTEGLLREKNMLLHEMEHRVANSLQIIASILLLKARAVTSPETRQHLQDAHSRVMSVAAVQSYLHASNAIDSVGVDSYLEKLCVGLAGSMVGEGQPIDIKVIADVGMIDSAKAVSLGLIVTELVINAIKYAFPVTRIGATILVTYEIDGGDWKLTVSDNGIGKATGPDAGATGLGTNIVKALAKQLGATIETESSGAGMSIAVTRATFTSHMPKAA